MSNKRKKYSAQEEVRPLRLHLIEKEPVSDICDRHALKPNAQQGPMRGGGWRGCRKFCWTACVSLRKMRWSWKL